MTALHRSLALSIILVVSVESSAAELSIDDITVPEGTPTVDVPVRITSTTMGEMIGAMNLFFSAGALADTIPVLNTGTEFDGSIWDNGNFFGVAGTPELYSAFTAVAMISPLEVSPDGIAITYTLDTSNLPGGTYVLNPNLESLGTGTSAANGNMDLLDLTFVNGMLHIQSMNIQPGDYNNNGLVEQADLDLVLLNWGAAFDTLPPEWINERPTEGIVAQAQLDGVLLNWGMSGGQMMAAAGVPEPTTLAAAALFAIVGVLTFRRHRRA